MQECVDSRSQRKARTRAIEEQRAAHQVCLSGAAARAFESSLPALQIFMLFDACSSSDKFHQGT